MEKRKEEKTRAGPEKEKERREGKEKEKKKKRVGPVDLLTSPSPIILGFLCTWPMPASPSVMDTQAGPNQPIWASLFTVHKPNPNWASQKSKAQLKWAPATSKDGSDHDPPSPVIYS
jgi:hypothetical protein